MRSLGWTHVSVQIGDPDASEYELQSVELEENIKREDITWQEEVAAVEKFHSLKQENVEGWTQYDTAAALGYSQAEVNKRLSVAAELGNETVAKAERLSAAANIVQRNAERKKTSALDSIGKTFAAVATNENSHASPPAPVVPLLRADFHEWRQSYDGPKFNLIHCDFPYGINVADTPRMGAAMADHYDDSKDVYDSLLQTLAAGMDNVVADSAHLIFWHSMKFHSETVLALRAMGWEVNPFPLIWHKSDGAGIAPNPQKDPRQVYEAAIFASRGGRLLTAAGCINNVFAHPGRRGEDTIHISEKPQAMLRHFFRMVCDDHSFVLDPTCGSGNALKVAQDMGAPLVLGIEKSEDFYETACLNWEKRDA